MKREEKSLKVDLARLRELVKYNVIQSQSDTIDKVIESLHDRQDFARYHYHAYKEIISKVDNDLSKIKLALKIDDADQKDVIAIKSNIASCIQSIHITHDILSYLIATALKLDLNEKDISFVKVKEQVNKFKNLKNLLNEFSNHDDYKYLISYVNHTKHRFHVDSKLTFHFTGDKHCTAMFEKFSFKGADFTEQEIGDFLCREYNREQKLISGIENELIDILEQQGGN